MKKRDVLTRLLERVEVNEDTGCWEWQGSRLPTGYGHIKSERRMVKTHRVTYSHYVGDIPDGLCVLHRCDNPCCCNPEHLFLGTLDDNNKDRTAKGRGVRPPNSGVPKIPSEKIEQIFSLREQGLTHQKISDRLGVARSTVGNYLSGVSPRC